MRTEINIDVAVDKIVERILLKYPQLMQEEIEVSLIINQAICDAGGMLEYPKRYQALHYLTRYRFRPRPINEKNEENNEKRRI